MFHQGYEIKKVAGKYVASPVDGDHLEVVSIQVTRLLAAISALWQATSQLQQFGSEHDRDTLPRWIREWIASPTKYIDMDDAYKRGAC